MGTNGRRRPARPVSLLLASSGRRLLIEAIARIVASDGDGLRLSTEPKHDEEAILRAVGKTRPSVLVLDVDGESPSRTIDLVARVKAASARTRVLVLFASADDRDLFILDYVEAGADGFLDRTSALGTLLNAVRAAADGVLVLPDAEVTTVLRKAAQEREGMRRMIELSRSMTERETEVLGLVARAYTNDQIAEELHVSVRTVATHVQNVYRKMGVHSRLEAVALANRLNLLPPDRATVPVGGGPDVS